MKKVIEKIVVWFLFTFLNPVVRRGGDEAFKYVFRRFWLEIRTVSGNFKVRIMADEHPYSYLLAGLDQGHEDNVFGYARALYMVGSLLTTDQQFVDDIRDAIISHSERLSKKELEPEETEKEALEEVKKVQEYVDMPKKEQRAEAKRINRRFKKVVKDLEKSK